MSLSFRRSIAGSSSLAALATLALLTSPAQAQEGESDAQSQGARPNDADIVVTGSRIVRKDYTSNTPVTTVDSTLLTNTSDFALESKLQQLPQFASSTNSQFNTAYTNVGASTLNLRNIGENRNLVLLDGRRLQPSTASFAIDVNTIPASLISSVEVITGGASAVYGSDAISGVINFKLKRNFEGLQLDVQQGITQAGDLPTTSATATFGVNLANEGNVVFAVDYSRRGSFRQRDRRFYTDAFAANVAGGNILSQGVYRPVAANLPSQAAINNYFAAFGAPPGAVLRTNDLGFNNDDTSLFNVVGTDIYNFTSRITGRQGIVQTTATAKSVNEYTSRDQILAIPTERISLFARATINLSDTIEAYGQGYFTHYDATTEGGPAQAGNFWALTVPFDANHPVPSGLATILSSRPNPTASWTLQKALLFLGQRVSSSQADVFQVLGGVKGELGLGDWTWDLSASHGNSRSITTGTSGFALGSRLQLLINAPNYGKGYSDASGTCTTGLDPFGISQVSADCIKFVSGRPVNQTQLSQDVAELNLQGGLLELPAGQVRAAVGFGYRRNSYQFNPDQILTVARSSALDVDYTAQFATLGTSGSVSTKEVYGELVIPLLRDVPLIHSLEASLAYRYSDYSRTGGVHAYKADANWQVIDALRVRGGYQRAVRAPNVTELLQPATPVLATPQDLCQSNLTAPYSNRASNPDRAKVQQLCRTLMGAGAPAITDPANDPYGLNTYLGGGNISISNYVSGNPALSPETADTLTAGIVFQPRWNLPLESRLTLSVDYYDIKIGGLIGFVTSQQAYDLCFNANGMSNPDYLATNTYCQAIGRVQIPGSNGIPNLVSVSYQNQGNLKTRGIDIQADLSMKLGGGTFRIASLANYLNTYKLQTTPGTSYLEYAGASGGGPGTPAGYFRWKLFNTFTYTLSDITLGLRWQHLSPVKNVAKVTAPTSTLPDIAAYDLIDLFTNIKIGREMQLRAGVTNLFNKQPPVTGAFAGTTNPYDYDIVGRRFFVGATVNF